MNHKAEQAIAVVIMLIGTAILLGDWMTKQFNAGTIIGAYIGLASLNIFTTNMTIKDQNDKRRDKR